MANQINRRVFNIMMTFLFGSKLKCFIFVMIDQKGIESLFIELTEHIVWCDDTIDHHYHHAQCLRTQIFNNNF